MLKITYFGRTTFALESKDTSVLINPGIWDGETVVPDDYDVRVIVTTHHMNDAVGNAAKIAEGSKAWILGNEKAIERAKSEGGKPWLLHVLKSEEPYEIPGLKLTPFALHRKDPETSERVENMGLHIEMGNMKLAYLGDTIVRGPFGKLETDILIAPVAGGDVFPVKDAVSLCIDASPRIGIPCRITEPEQATKFAKYLDQFSKTTTPVIMEENQILEVDWAAGNEFRYTIS
ncbi:MAG: MBL fold metallo-hydrolase [Candidatus Thorarchaeota archaeon]